MNAEGLAPAAGMSRLVLIRHGEPEEWVRGRCYGDLDPGLSCTGREQVRRVRRWLQGQSVEAIYSSPRRRALESAELLTADGRVVQDNRFREISFGEFESLTYEEIAERFPDTYEEWMRRPTEVSFPGGERFRAMTRRVREALCQVRDAHRGQVVVLVSHGGVNRIALADALGMPPSLIFRLHQDHGCVNVIDYVRDEPIVRLVNGACTLQC